MARQLRCVTYAAVAFAWLYATVAWAETPGQIKVQQPAGAYDNLISLSPLGGAGVSITLGEGTVVRPVVTVGYSYSHGDALVAGVAQPHPNGSMAGIVLDGDRDRYMVGGGVELGHQRSLGSSMNLAANFRYDHFSTRLSPDRDPALAPGGIDLLTSRLKLDGPTGITLLDHELRWIGFVSNTYVPGGQNDETGYSYYFAFGGGAEILDRGVVEGVDGASVRASAIVGDKGVGMAVGLQLKF